MMKTFTQNLLACVALLALFSTNMIAQSFMVVNSPGDIAGDIEVLRAGFGDQDETKTTTGDLILGDDGDASDSNGDGVPGTTTDGCQPVVTDATGQVIILDRGDCSFVTKANSAQASGAIALLVCNNASGDAIVMTGEAPDVTIPCFMATMEDCATIKMSINDGNTVNVTFEEREEECPVTYGPNVFWGDQPGQGDFSVPFDQSGWTTVNLEPLDRDEVVWTREEDGTPIFYPYFGNGVVLDSPSECNGTAQFSFAAFQVADNPAPTQPYTTYSAELISPIIDCTGKDFIIIEYYQAYNRLNSFSRFAWSIDGGDTWTEEDVEHLTTVNEEVDNRKVVKPLPDFTNEPNCRIKFISLGDFYYWNIDDVTLKSEEVKDIRAEPDFYATAPNYLAPLNQADEIPFLIDLKNTGNSDLATEVLVEVIKDGNVVHTQTLDYGVIPAGADADNQAFPSTYTPDAGAGEYTIRYTAISRDGDGDDTNNVRETTFMLEEDGMTMSKLPLNYANLGNWGIVGESNRSFGNYYRFPNNRHTNGNLITIESVDAGITQDETDIAMEGFLKAEVYTWVDFPPIDGICQPEERTPIGEGRLLDITNGVGNILLADINDSDAQIVLDVDSGDGVLVMVHMNSLNSPVTWRPRAISAPGEQYNLVASILAYDSLAIQSYGSMEATGSSFADVDTRSFETSGQLTYYTPIYLGEKPAVAVNDFDETIKFDVYPNPTSANINIDLSLEEKVDYAIVKILDSTGKFVRGLKYNDISERNISIDMSPYNAGLYTLVVQTPNGFSSKQFTVIK